MRREQRQTGNTRAAKPSKMDAVYPPAAAAAPPGPFPWDRYLQHTKKPSNRALRRNYGSTGNPETRKR